MNPSPVLSAVIVGINIPATPSDHVPYVASRAKALLAKRSFDETLAAIQWAGWIISDFYSRLQKQFKANFKRHLEAELRIRNDLDALKLALVEYDLQQNPSFPDAKIHEYLAAYSLQLIAQAIELIKIKPEGHVSESVKTRFALEQHAQFHNLLFIALDSIAHAEKLYLNEKLVAENLKITQQLQAIQVDTAKIITQEVKKKISLSAQKAAIEKHKIDYEIQAQVEAWLEEQCMIDQKFLSRSNNKVAEDILRAEIVERGFETLTKYVREFRRNRQKAA